MGSDVWRKRSYQVVLTQRRASHRAREATRTGALRLQPMFIGATESGWIELGVPRPPHATLAPSTATELANQSKRLRGV